VVSPLDGIAFQRQWESRAYELGGGDYIAPGQRVGDFLARQVSSAFGSVQPSYTPGVRPTDLAAPGRESLPTYALEAIREALPAFERQIRGFAMPDAVLTGVETRTSSPLRITRGPDYQSLNVRGLYPAGEGAGTPAASCRRGSTASRLPKRWLQRQVLALAVAAVEADEHVSEGERTLLTAAAEHWGLQRMLLQPSASNPAWAMAV
jgi:hypothetical protein